MLYSLLKDLWRRPEPSRDGPSGNLSGELVDAKNLDLADFTQALLTEFFVLAHKLVPDNYDHGRYGFDGVDRSSLIAVDTHAGYLKFFFDHAGEFFASYQLLRDAGSRELFRRLVLYRMLGHTHVVIRDGVGWSNESEFAARSKQYDVGESHLKVDSMFGSLRHHTGIPTPDGPVSLDVWNGNVTYTILKKQYFLSRGDIVIEPRAGDIVIDAGALFGDTAVHFAKIAGAGGHVYAFDPLPNHMTVCEFNVAQNNLQNRITLVQSAVGASTTGTAQVQVRSDGGNLTASPGFSMRGFEADFPITSIDDFVREKNVPRVDFIKMDIEGFELAALIGAEKTIDRFRPRLAISLYHRPEDFFEIPLWLGKRFPWYNLHLDHYTIHQEETVLFASARPL